METKLCHLSPEVLEIIFQFLQPKDLCSLSQVNRKVCAAASNPEFFSKLGRNPSLKSKIEENGIEMFLGIARLQNIRDLDLSYTELPPTYYDRLIRHINDGGLKKLAVINLSDIDKTAIDAENLGIALIKMRKVNLCGPNNMMTTMQCQQLMNNINNVEPNLRKLQVLDIAHNNLSEVISDSLAKAVVTMREVDLEETDLSLIHILTLPTNREV